MFITVHAAVGTVIGRRIASAPIAFVLAFLSHFVFDIIPHGDQNLGKKFFGLRFKTMEPEKGWVRNLALYGLLDAFLLAAYIMFLFRTFEFAKTDSVTWGIIGGILPDLLVGLYAIGKFKSLEWFYNLHNKNHHILLNKIGSDIPLQYGLIVQTITMVSAIFLLNRI